MKMEKEKEKESNKNTQNQTRIVQEGLKGGGSTRVVLRTFSVQTEVKVL